MVRPLPTVSNEWAQQAKESKISLDAGLANQERAFQNKGLHEPYSEDKSSILCEAMKEGKKGIFGQSNDRINR